MPSENRFDGEKERKIDVNQLNLVRILVHCSLMQWIVMVFGWQMNGYSSVATVFWCSCYRNRTLFWFSLVLFTFKSVPFDWKFLIHSPTNFSSKALFQWYEWIDIGWIKLKSLWVYTCFLVPKNALCTVHIPGNWWMNLRLSTFSMKVTKPSKLHRNRISLCCHSTASKWSSHGEKEWNKIISCVLSLRKQLSPTAGTRIFQQCAYQEYSINGLAVCFKCGDAKMHVYWWRR